MLDFGFHRRKSVLNVEDEFDNEAYQREKEAKLDQIDNNLLPDYGDDYDDYVQNRRRKLFSLVTQETNNTKLNSSDTRLHKDQLKRKQYKDNDPQPQPEPEKPAVRNHWQVTSKNQMHMQQNQTEVKQEGPIKKVEQIKPKEKRPPMKQRVKSVESAMRPGQTNPQSVPVVREQLKEKEQRVVPSEQLNSEQRQRSHKMNHTHIQRLRPIERDTVLPKKPTVAMQRRIVTRQMEIQPNAKKHFTTQKRDNTHPRLNQKDRDTRKRLRDKEIEINMPLQQDIENSIGKGKIRKKWSDTKAEEDKVYNRADNRRDTRKGQRDSLWGPGGDFEGADDEDLTPPPVFDTEVNWSQTFQVKPLDLQTLRSDWIDLRCNVSGNLLLRSNDVQPVVKAFMNQLNKKHNQ